MTLSKEEKENWIIALRSGNYKQGTGLLWHRWRGEYCCIGVFAVCSSIPISEDGEEMLNEFGDGIGYRLLEDKIGKENSDKLWQMNDNEGKTFSEIADWIEQNL